MKKSTFLLAAGALLLFSTSCGVSAAYLVNQNQNSTQVHLSSNNYEVIDKVAGSSDVTYVLIFGGMKKSDCMKMPTQIWSIRRSLQAPEHWSIL
ncbi:MAG: DUF6567 family protein [Ekhidna sp.]